MAALPDHVVGLPLDQPKLEVGILTNDGDDSIILDPFGAIFGDLGPDRLSET